jgi:hypothetical protein
MLLNSWWLISLKMELFGELSMGSLASLCMAAGQVETIVAQSLLRDRLLRPWLIVFEVSIKRPSINVPGDASRV